MRTTRYTYVRDLNGPWLLYDNQADPYQSNNLASQPKYSRLQVKLDNLLTRKLKGQHDQFLPGDAYVSQWGYKVDANGTCPIAHNRTISCVEAGRASVLASPNFIGDFCRSGLRADARPPGDWQLAEFARGTPPS